METPQADGPSAWKTAPMSAGPILEIAANSLASALAAQQGGASRIELCTALEVGGLTPSPAQIALVRERLSIPVHVLVRPRAGDFAYSDEEHATMLADIAHCAVAGCDGVVVGALTADGDVDVARCRELVSAAARFQHFPDRIFGAEKHSVLIDRNHFVVIFKGKLVRGR